MQAMEISRTGLDVEWRRLEVIAQNLANVSTVRDAYGQTYRALRLITGPRADFAAHLAGREQSAALAGVTVFGVEPAGGAPRRVHEPQNPQADADGYVTYAAVDQAAEMALMVKTARAYEANIAAMGAARQMYTKALELGKR
ncbi:MAG TPA: flagellar basal body rod protein FlgC [Caulobacteraceae bacterium]|jgi:flagellar basal-body rod protein FlgC